jgi:predicted nucleotidyltransferase
VNQINNIDKIKSFEDISQIVSNILINHKPEYIYIYGSRARNNNRTNSDVDIMVFWKYPVPNYDILCEIKKQLINELNLNVDFVVMQLTNKIIKVNDEGTLCYYDNISNDAKCIYFARKNNNINDLLCYSIKLQKIN